jgi:hypothetical protein
MQQNATKCNKKSPKNAQKKSRIEFSKSNLGFRFWTFLKMSISEKPKKVSILTPFFHLGDQNALLLDFWEKNTVMQKIYFISKVIFIRLRKSATKCNKVKQKSTKKRQRIRNESIGTVEYVCLMKLLKNICKP